MRVRILAPIHAPGRGAPGDVIDVDDDEGAVLVASGAAEETGDTVGEWTDPPAVQGEGLTTYNEGHHEVDFTPLPVAEPEEVIEPTDDEGQPINQSPDVETPEPAPEEPQGGEDAAPETGTGAYEGRTVEQLRATARAKGLEGYSGLTKDELIALIRGD